MPVRALLIDLDNTLLAEDDATMAALRRASGIAEGRSDALAAAAAAAAERLFAAADVYSYADRIGVWWGEALWGDFSGDDPGLRALRAFVPGYRQAVWSAALGAVGLDERRAAALSDAFAKARRSDWALDPAAIRVIDALAARHRIAIVTNGAPAVQREKLTATGLDAHVVTVVISGELGIGKPEAGIFIAALERLGVDAADTVVVGDSVERDIAGARAAGLRVIWLDRQRSGQGHGDARIATLDELPAALESIGDPIPSAGPA